ncbi:MAG: SpoIID/LytB domain-containing protein [Prevotella sp.]|nr:SpoIID/LytB domain-containing protein [Bacteroides sp.]MCM1365693.1 SpoIID/LytB domain-containing protein [Prevotella sp.]MCM1437147.1 SpoIID/LytB domain-containing protein [Prevotella sp.]
MKLRVNILTKGYPEVEARDYGFDVRNAVIGEGFHWESVRELRFEGKYEIKGGQLFNIIDLEDYIKSVIASEMNPDSPEEFLKSHAVISRSWAYGKVKHAHSDNKETGKVRTSTTIVDWDDTSDHKGYDLCNDDHCQRYQGLNESPIRNEIAKKIVESTSGLILTDRNDCIVDARFSKHCGGHREIFSTCWQDEDLEYLPGEPDPFCDLSDLNESERSEFLTSILNKYDIDTPFEHWEVRITKSDVQQKIKDKLGYNTGKIFSISPMERGKSGRIKVLEINSENPLKIGKELMIRRIFSETHLYSSLFEIEDTGDEFRLSGKGWGHGVGLCQIGAARMAREGADFRQILQFYYPGTKLTNLSEFI